VPEQLWSTASLPEAEQFPFWREVVWEAFVPVTLGRCIDEGGFVGHVAAASVGPLGVSTIASQAQTVERTEADVRRQAGDVFFLNMPLRGASTISQGERSARLGPGDFAIVDGSQPFELRFEDDFDQVSLTLPHDLLGPLLADPGAATAAPVRGDSGLGTVAGGAVRALAQGAGAVEAAPARALAERFASLLALSLGARGPAARDTRRAILQAALDEVERSLGDPLLTPTLLAGRVGISTRYLHQLFGERGPSFGRWLRERRLERCRLDLGDAEFAQLTIGEIAWRNGFADPSHMARAFRDRYGISPSEHRRAAAARAALGLSVVPLRRGS
jgi:AraC-like DNA-binding protein